MALRIIHFLQISVVAYRGLFPNAGKSADLGRDHSLASRRLFATLECELLDRRRFKPQIEASMAIFEFIEGWYDPHRRHSALDYLSPIDYERAYGAQLNLLCCDQQPLKESAPPPTPAGKMEDLQDVISIKKIGEPLNRSPSPTPSAESG